MEASILSGNNHHILEKVFIVAICILTTGCRHRMKWPLTLAADSDLSVKSHLLKIKGNLAVAKRNLS